MIAWRLLLLFRKISKEEKEEAIPFFNNIPKDCLKKVLVASSSPISKPP